MEHVRRELKVSERRACLVLRQARAVQQYTPQVRDDENALTGRIVELAAVYGRYGSPRITGLSRNAMNCWTAKSFTRCEKRRS